MSEATEVKLGGIPEDSSIIFYSTKGVKNAGPVGPSNIYAMNEEGGNVTQLTFNPKMYEHAALSPDRKMIAANANDGTRSELWVFDLEQKTERQISSDFSTAGNGGIDWDRSGFIYFAGQKKGSGAQNIYKIKPDGSGLYNITNLVQKPPPNPEPAYFSDVSVSEDGTMLAAFRYKAVEKNGAFLAKPQIWVMNSGGKNLRLVDDGGDESGTDSSGFPLGDYDPEISPDNKFVVFSRVNTKHKNFRNAVNTAHDLWIAPVDGSSPARILTQPGPVSIIPDWQGDKILYTEYNEAENYIGLVTIRPDGSKKKRLEKGLKGLWDGGRHGKWIPTGQ